MYPRGHGGIAIAAKDPLVRIRRIVEAHHKWVLCRARDVLCRAGQSSAVERKGEHNLHVIIKMHECRIEMRDILRVFRVIQLADDSGEGSVLDASERMSVDRPI